MPKTHVLPTIDTLKEFHAVDHEELLASREQILVSVALAADLLNLSERRIRQLVDEGLPSYWDPNGLRVRWPAALRWRDQQIVRTAALRTAGTRGLSAELIANRVLGEHP